jgi:DNA-binding LytR/AlgR family response regulator
VIILFKIAVCDDDSREVEHIKDELNEYFKYREYADVEIQCFFSPDKMQESISGFNLLILDVEIDDVNGIDFAAKLRDGEIYTPIIYISNYPKYAFESFKVHPFGYISKPFVQADIKRVLDDFLDKQIETTKKPICFRGQKQTVLLAPDDICYFCYIGRKDIIAVTQNDQISIKETLSDINVRVIEYGFFLINRTALINLKHIKAIKNSYTLIMTNGDALEIAQKKRHEFYKRLSKHAYESKKRKVSSND